MPAAIINPFFKHFFKDVFRFKMPTKKRRKREPVSARSSICRYFSFLIFASLLSFGFLSVYLSYEELPEEEAQVLDFNVDRILEEQEKSLHSITKYSRPEIPAERKNYNKKFLVPVLPFDVGPNNLFRHFKEAVPFAKALNFTLVIPPFHRHPRMEIFIDSKENKETEETVNVPIFDTEYSVEIESQPEHTIDYELLRALLPAVTYKEFEANCGKTIDMLVECGDIDPKRHQGFKYFSSATGLKIAHRMSISNFPAEAEAHNLLKKLEQSSSKCVGFAIGKKCLGERKSYMKNWKQNYAQFVRRPLDVQRAALEFFRDVFGGEKFAGIHWRYDKYDWNDMCKESRPEAAKARNGQICEYAEKLEDGDHRLLEKMSTNLKVALSRANVHHGYMTGPPQINNTMAAFKRKIPSLRTVDDLKFWINEKQPGMKHLLETNYLISHLEQEIMFLSAKFIGSPLSSWTQTVFYDRMAFGIEGSVQ